MFTRARVPQEYIEESPVIKKEKKKHRDRVIQGEISMDEYLMGIAVLSSRMSKIPYLKSGACIVNKDGILISTGFCKTDEDNIIPALQDALINSGCYPSNLVGATVYINLFPGENCVKMLTNCGITKVVYLKDEHIAPKKMQNSKTGMEESGIECISYADLTKSKNKDKVLEIQYK